LTCADGKSPAVPEGHGKTRIPANNAEGHASVKRYDTPDIPNFMLSPNSFTTRRKHCGACITAIDDEEIVVVDHAKEKFAEL